jgi:hypothetical protein
MNKLIGLCLGTLVLAGCNSPNAIVAENTTCAVLVQEQAQVANGSLKLSAKAQEALTVAMAACVGVQASPRDVPGYLS